jgi:hypothetical protein
LRHERVPWCLDRGIEPVDCAKTFCEGSDGKQIELLQAGVL